MEGICDSYSVYTVIFLSANSLEQTLSHTEIHYAFLVSAIQATDSAHCSLLDLTTLTLQGEPNKS